MKISSKRSASVPAAMIAALACALALPTGGAADTPAQTGAPGRPSVPVKPPATATLEQCVTAVEPVERSATFVGEMTAIPGTARMLMRIEVLERAPSEALFRTVAYPGLGQWLRAVPGVHTYKNLDKVTNLSAPALYRAAIHYRWLNAKGHLLKSLELRTGRCDEPAPPVPATAPGQTFP
jgi:hypothetical protein